MKLHLRFFCLFLITALSGYAQVKQVNIPRVDKMADLPQPLRIIDWHRMSLDFDSTIYDFQAQEPYWPMVWIDSTGKNICREGWGFLIGKWNGIDISGTVGSTVDHGGYGFLMNTFDAAWPLIPLVKYQPSYATAIGKWMLIAANASRYFYNSHWILALVCR